MRSGCPGPTSARKIELRPLWLPDRISTSRADAGVTPAGVKPASSAANQDCSSGIPATGEREMAASVRAARVMAARTRRSGSSSRSGYPA